MTGMVSDPTVSWFPVCGGMGLHHFTELVSVSGVVFVSPPLEKKRQGFLVEKFVYGLIMCFGCTLDFVDPGPSP